VLQLFQTMPDPEVLLALEPEELAAKMIFLIRQREGTSMFNVGSLRNELWTKNLGQPLYPVNRKTEIDLAIAEALAWLEVQGLIVSADSANGPNGWRHFSRRARRFESEADVDQFLIARRLPRDVLHPRVANAVWQEFIRGQYDVAVFQAMKAVEVAVREAGRMPSSLLGVKLMRAAFNPKDGPLTDSNAEEGEKVARMELFAGAIGSYKNPHSHRDVSVDDPGEAIEIVLLATHLLRIVDAREKARQPS
jgi:uncharacterized protein (TIGR02391 family)